MTKKEAKFTKKWMGVILLTLSFSVFSLGVDFNLIKVENISFWSYGDTKSIVDKSTMSNCTFDVFTKNNIDSNVSVSYSKINNLLSDHFTRKLWITNNDKINYHNIIWHDNYGNTVFVKDHLYNITLGYGEGNSELTDFVIYSSFLVENNRDHPPCFETGTVYKSGNDSIIQLIPLDYFFAHPEKCRDFVNITQ